MSDTNLRGDPPTPEPWRRAHDRTREGHRATDDVDARRHAAGPPHHDLDRLTAYPRHGDVGHSPHAHDRPNALRSARAGARRIEGANGTAWLVYEYRGERQEEGSLVFESECVIRRLRVFPRDWRELSDSTLANLCQDL